ncbi:hypothetical protein AB1N83_013643 [Pleurotus pulmonarius]
MSRWHTNPAPKLDANVHIQSRPRLYKKPHNNICLDHELRVLSHHSRIIPRLNALPASSATDYQRRNQQIVALTSDVPATISPFTQFSTTNALSEAQNSGYLILARIYQLANERRSDGFGGEHTRTHERRGNVE